MRTNKNCSIAIKLDKNNYYEIDSLTNITSITRDTTTGNITRLVIVSNGRSKQIDFTYNNGTITGISTTNI